MQLDLFRNLTSSINRESISTAKIYEWFHNSSYVRFNDGKVLFNFGTPEKWDTRPGTWDP